MNNTRNNRNYAIDLLKCLSMLMIVFLHATGSDMHGAVINRYGPLHLLVTAIQSVCSVGVNCFVLITGYFLSIRTIELNKKGLVKSYKRLVPLWIQVIMYSAGIYIILCLIPLTKTSFNVLDFTHLLFPMMNGSYWFFTAYALLCIVSPFLNRLILHLEKNEYKVLLIVLLICFSVIPTINVFGDKFGTNSGFSIIWFVVLYLIAGYLRKFSIKPRRYLLMFFAICLGVFLFYLIREYGNQGYFFSFINSLVKPYNSVLICSASVCLFLSFEKSSIMNNNDNAGRIISYIASLTFGVYLFHECPGFKDVLWNSIICFENYSNNEFICIVVLFIAVLSIYAIGLLIESMRTQAGKMIIDISKRFKRSLIKKKESLIS